MKYFLLFSNCIPVEGAKRGIICDLQRDSYIFIPSILVLILQRLKKQTIEEIKIYFDKKHDQEIDDFFNYLVLHEYGFFTDEITQFPQLDLNNFLEPRPITNCLIDVNEKSNHDFNEIIGQLSELLCETLEIRFYDIIRNDQILNVLSLTEYSTLRSVEILLHYTPDLTVSYIENLCNTFPRLKKVIVHSAPFSNLVSNDLLFIVFTEEIINSEKCCGIVDPWYFISKTEVFIESKKFNNCLNKKIGIDTNGNIKNCPSLEKSYGNIGITKLITVANLPEFTKLWNLNKDQIEICRDCEFRYICQDCRAYILDQNNIYSKPLKCSYDPYEAKWK